MVNSINTLEYQNNYMDHMKNTIFKGYKPLKNSNSKLGKNVLDFSINPIDTCLNCEKCKPGCYAVRNMRYPAVKLSYALNTYLAYTDIEYLKNSIINQLKNTDKKIVRIHPAGDFFSVRYILMWHEIAEAFPGITFYSYTKVYSYGVLGFFLNRLQALKNVNIVNSVPLNKNNFGDPDYIHQLKNDIEKAGEKAFICQYGTANQKKCMSECTACLHCKNVLFYQH